MARSSSRPSGRRAKPRPTAASALPTLSVVLPAYKVAPYLERCLDSLLLDAPPGLELIVVDDGSPDEAGEIAERRAAADPRLRVIHQENAGVAAARNAGLDAACGDYVGFVDPDDMVERGWARALLQAAARQRPAIVRGEWREVRRDGSSPPHPSCTQALQPTPLSWYGPMWCAIFRRDYLAAHALRHPVGRIYSQDLGFVVQAVVAAMAAGERIIPCPKACYLYLRRGGGNDRRALSHAHMASILGILEDLHRLLLQQAAHLPPMGMAAQYYQYMVNLHSNYASRAQDPADAAAAQALARRLLRECPVPGELRQMHQQQLAASRAAGSPAVHPALQAFFAQAEQFLSGTAAPAVPAVSPPAQGGPAPAAPPPQSAAVRGWQADPPGGEPPPHAEPGEQAAAPGLTSLPADCSRSDERSRPVFPPAAGQVPVRQPPSAATDPVPVLLRRARELLGEDGGGEGTVELARCLRRLYRAQNHLDHEQLRQLGLDCLQAIKSGLVEGASQLQETAAILAQLTPAAMHDRHDAADHQPRQPAGAHQSRQQVTDTTSDDAGTQRPPANAASAPPVMTVPAVPVTALQTPLTYTFITYKDLFSIIKASILRFSKYDLIVGIPRSGMIPAYMIGLLLNKPVCSLSELVARQQIRSFSSRPLAADGATRSVIILDDSSATGGTLHRARAAVEKGQMHRQLDIDYGVIFALPQNCEQVFHLKIIPQPRLFEWNYTNHVLAGRWCYDLDGVLCPDPSPGDNDDGARYMDFILNAPVLFAPRYPIGAIVTARLEKYREPTSTWLQRHEIQYQELIMLDLPDQQARIRARAHARHKIDFYKKSDRYDLFLESDRAQALEIAHATRKQVICTTTGEYFRHKL